MVKDTTIYLDYAAATPLDDKVLRAMHPFLTDQYFNPSALYRASHEVKSLYEDARHTVAKALGAKNTDIFFTAGATESINTAFFGVIEQYGGSILVSSIEHDAVLAAAQRYPHSLVSADKNGYIQPSDIEQSITDETTLVSIGYINNELGTVQSIKQIAEIVQCIREKRAKKGITHPLFLHTDASQATGLLDISVSRLGVDLMTLNAGKCYGPKQVGLLWRHQKVLLKPLLVGGGQEYGLRSGTENVAGVIGFAKALQMAIEQRKTEPYRLEGLRMRLQKKLEESVNGLQINGHPKRHAPHILHVSIPRLDGERLVYALDNFGVMAATGSACAANRSTGSHVLKAIGMEEAERDGSLRFSFGRYTTEEEIDKAASIIATVVGQERSI